MKIEQLRQILEKCWCVETAYRGDRYLWSHEKSMVGQCTVTALIIFDYFGGKIVRGYSEKYNIFHYWNEIDGKCLDLTFEQFQDKPDIKFTKLIYKNKEDLLKIYSVKKRYEYLKNLVSLELNKHNL